VKEIKMSMDKTHQAHRTIDAALHMLENDEALYAGHDYHRYVSPFARLLYQHSALEDIQLYSPTELATMAQEAFQQVVNRTPGQASIRVLQPSQKAEGHTSNVTIIEIVNDDMPFLVDSVMGELQDSNLELHLVLHPILWLSRDEHGNIISFLWH
jgi:glutamate dehydrogenase